MLYSRHITYTAGGTASSPSRTQLKVNQGVIARVWVHFPPGCAGLTRLRIYHEGHPFLPVEKDAYISGDNYVFDLPMFYEITDEPQQITIEGWNEDEVYSHTVDILMLVLPREAVYPVGAAEGIVSSLRSLLIRKSRAG